MTRHTGEQAEKIFMTWPSHALTMRSIKDSRRDLLIACVVIGCIGLGLFLDSNSSLTGQNTLGVCAWSILLALLAAEDNSVRAQVAVAVMFTTVGEYFASPFLGAYIYRFDNVPAYVPPGHGMVYLAAVALGRSPLLHLYRWWITGVALLLGALWSLWGITLADRADAVGALLFCIFLGFALFGRSPLLYVAAFFITSYLELLGTWLGTWTWSVRDPALGLSQANPPSGIAAWYCLVDAVALGGGPLLAAGLASLGRALGSSRLVESQGVLASDAREVTNED